MNNDRSPAWKLEKVVTINSEFSLRGLIINNIEYVSDTWSFIATILLSTNQE